MADATIFSYSTIDQLGLVAPVNAYAAYDGATETVDALIGSWLELGGLINAATTSKITGGTITIPLLPDASWKAVPAAGIDNSDVIVVNMLNDFNSYVTEFVLPGYLAAMKAGGKVVLTQTQLAAITARLINDAGTVFFQSRDIHQLNAVKDAFLTDRKRRNERLLTRSRPT